jgi:hypothetical protein
MDENLYTKRHKLRWRWDGENGEHITFQHPRTGSINVLNPIGATVFHLSDGNHTIKAIIDQILDEFDAPNREVVAKDVYDFIDFLKQAGVVMLLEG